jgi:hypothetical protein
LKIRNRDLWNKDLEERKRIMGMKSGYLVMKKEYEYSKKKGIGFRKNKFPRPPKLRKSSGEKVGGFHLRDEAIEKLKQMDGDLKDLNIDSVVLEELRGKADPDENYKLFVERNHPRNATEKMRHFLTDEPHD